MSNKIALACDHGGYELKEATKKYLESKGIEYIDFGCNGESVNYPEYAHKLCVSIQDGTCYRGILFCGTGIGISIAANKHKGIRAACCSDVFSARLTREHNDANVLCFGQRVVGIGLALDLVDAFLDAEYANSGNHLTRVALLKDIEDANL